MVDLSSGRCSYHPQTPGIGICIECRAVICAECTTQFEGINRCARCLAQKTRAPSVLRSGNQFSVANLVLAALSFFLIFGIVRLAAALG
jgi:hypothetical protein